MKKKLLLMFLGLNIFATHAQATAYIDNDNAIRSEGINPTISGSWQYQSRGYWGDSRITTSGTGSQAYSWQLVNRSLLNQSNTAYNFNAYFYIYLNDPQFTANVRYASGYVWNGLYNNTYINQDLAPAGWFELSKPSNITHPTYRTIGILMDRNGNKWGKMGADAAQFR